MCDDCGTLLDHWDVYGDLGNQWNEASIDLSSFNTSDVLIRFRVVTGNDYSSDVAVDKLSILGGPITVEGDFLTDVAIGGIHNLIYSIQGCDDFVDITVNEIDAGVDQIVCPLQAPFNLSGFPNGGIWNGNNITNTSLGTFDPSLGLGLHNITYSYNGCVDTSEIWVVDTDVQVDSLFYCINSGFIYYFPITKRDIKINSKQNIFFCYREIIQVFNQNIHLYDK